MTSGPSIGMWPLMPLTANPDCKKCKGRGTYKKDYWVSKESYVCQCVNRLLLADYYEKCYEISFPERLRPWLGRWLSPAPCETPIPDDYISGLTMGIPAPEHLLSDTASKLSIDGAPNSATPAP